MKHKLFTLARWSALPVLALLAAGLAPAQLTPEQREADFRTLVSSVSKFYGPLDWKRELQKRDPLDMTPWLERIRRAPNDVEFLQILAEYVASLEDGHIAFQVPSNFVADLGVRFDLYEGVPRVWSVTARYPADQFPGLRIGSELVSFNGEPAMDVVRRQARIENAGFERSALRRALIRLTLRQQLFDPKAIEAPDRVAVVLRSPEGITYTHELTYTKTGVPFLRFPPSENPKGGSSLNPSATEFEPTPALQTEANLMEPFAKAAVNSRLFSPDPEVQTNQAIGIRNPVYTLPPDFVQRRGRLASDLLFSGTYVADGLRIGLVRIGTFLFPNSAQALRELDEELTFMQANVDGLVVDVSRNNGGVANLVLDMTRRFMSRPFYYVPSQYLPRQRFLLNLNLITDAVRQANAETWVQQTWQSSLNQYREAYDRTERTLTGPMPFIVSTEVGALAWGPTIQENLPLGLFTKPMIVVADDLSVSGGDVFPALFQDNERAPVFGFRTGGLGASVFGVAASPLALPYSEVNYQLSDALMLRRQPISVPGYPVTRYIENVGVHPDIPYDSQTLENLTGGFRPYVAAITRAIVDHVRRSR